VDNEGHRGNDEQKVQGKRCDMKKQEAAYPKQNENNSNRQPHVRHTSATVSHRERTGTYLQP
jgi:hypothetical protein